MTVRTSGIRDIQDVVGESELQSASLDATARQRGVPMGGVLQGSAEQSPTLMILAMKDPDGANLDRVQVVKGWLDASGNSHERVYDVAWSGDRSPGADGKLPPVGNSVDLESARYRNDIGAAQLQTVWRDPDYRSEQAAFYYVRVLENPVCRWSTWDAIRAGETPRSDLQATIQERAWSSPIWYSASSGNNNFLN